MKKRKPRKLKKLPKKRARASVKRKKPAKSRKRRLSKKSSHKIRKTHKSRKVRRPSPKIKKNLRKAKQIVKKLFPKLPAAAKKEAKQASKKSKAAARGSGELNGEKEAEEVEETADRNSMQIYLKQIENISLLTPEDEINLSKLVHSRTRKSKWAREQMIRANLRLVISIAKRYTGLGLQFSDLVEEGNIGLMRGVEKFNWRRGYRFSTYASWWIKQSIMRAISNHGKTIRIPVYMFDTISKFRKVKDNLTHKFGRPPTMAEVAKVMRCTVEKVEEIENTISTPSSLNAPISLEKSAEVMELIEDRQAEAPTASVDAMFRNERVEQLLGLLDHRAREVLKRRYGLERDGEVQTLEQIANHFQITRERVRQIEVEAIGIIRQKLGEEGERVRND